MIPIPFGASIETLSTTSSLTPSSVRNSNVPEEPLPKDPVEKHLLLYTL